MSLFISFEGLDGSGKSTQAAMLVAALRDRGFDVVQTREPGSTPLGEQLRRFILDPTSPDPKPRAMALLLSAARAQLVDEVIRPALAAGRIVIADRYADSTIAYQGFGLRLEHAALEGIIAFATTGIAPDLIILLDIPPNHGMLRSHERGDRDRLDSQSSAFYGRVKDGYDYLAGLEPQRWRRIDGAQSEQSVHRAVLAQVEPVLVGGGARAV